MEELEHDALVCVLENLHQCLPAPSCTRAGALSAQRCWPLPTHPSASLFSRPSERPSPPSCLLVLLTPVSCLLLPPAQHLGGFSSFPCLGLGPAEDLAQVWTAGLPPCWLHGNLALQGKGKAAPCWWLSSTWWIQFLSEGWICLGHGQMDSISHQELAHSEKQTLLAGLLAPASTERLSKASKPSLHPTPQAPKHLQRRPQSLWQGLLNWVRSTCEDPHAGTGNAQPVPATAWRYVLPAYCSPMRTWSAGTVHPLQAANGLSLPRTHPAPDLLGSQLHRQPG